MPDFFSLLTSDAEEDRKQAVLQLVRERPPEARDLLERAATADPSPKIRYLARRAIAYMDQGRDSLVRPPRPEEEPTLRWIIAGSPEQRVVGLKMALKTGDRRAVPMLLPLLEKGDGRTQRAVLSYFARHGRPADFPHLIPLVHDRRPELRASVPPALLRCGGRTAIPYVAYLIQDPVSEVRGAARGTLGALPRRELLAALNAMIDARETWQRDSAAWALAHVQSPESVGLLARLLQDANPTVRQKARRGLERAAERGDARARELLAQAGAATVAGGAAGGGLSPRQDGTVVGAPVAEPPAVAPHAPPARPPVEEPPARVPAARSAGPLPGPAGAALFGAPVPGRPGAAPAAPPSPPPSRPASPPPADPLALSSSAVIPGGLLPALPSTLLADANPKVRLAALAAAINRNDTALLTDLLDRMSNETNPFVLARLIIAVGHLGARENGGVLAGYLDHADDRVAASAVEAIHLLGFRGAQARIRGMLGHRAPRVRANALLAVADEPDVDVGAGLAKMLAAPETEVRLSGLYALSRRGPRPHAALVERVLGDPADEVRERAVALLAEWAQAGHAEAQSMLDMCADGDVAIRAESVRLERAPAVRRMLAFAVDGAIFGAGTLLAAAIVIGLSGGMELGRPGPAQLVLFGVLATGTLAFMLRDGLRDGRGLAKGLFGLRAVDLATNQGCGWFGSLVRQGFLGLGLAAPVELVMLHTDEGGRRMADWLMHTQVVTEHRRPVGPLEWVGGSVVYATALLALFQTASSVVRFDDHHAATEMGIAVQLPRGWEFGPRTPTLVEMHRRSLARGPELTAKLRAYELRTQLARLGSPARGTLQLVDEGRRMRALLVDELKKAAPGVDVRTGPELIDRKAGGEPAYVFDLSFTRGGRESRARGILFRRGDRTYELVVDAPDGARLAEREPELDELLEKLAFL